jgi:ribosomal peptide maturation radical SAM protein 1
VVMVNLICMPYQNLNLSSLSIALLGSVLAEAGISHRQNYLHLEFARLIGPETYYRVSNDGTKAGLIGELLFAEDYHGHVVSDGHDVLLCRYFGDREARRALLARFREICIARLGAEPSNLMAMTTSINQLFPSIWMANLSKIEWPERKIVFGGSCCSVPMGPQILASYPEIDFVVSGYGEEPLLKLARDHANMHRGVVVNERTTALDSLPMPDYSEFLRQWDGFSNQRTELLLTFESSRGCWWGEKHHCKFCGINAQEMKFNSKSTSRVVEQIHALWDRHRVSLFATDSILSREHLREVMPKLAAREDKPKIFYEIKANMRAADVAQLKAANVTWVQPGIESLSSKLLRQLDKGVSAIQNLALLKWCREQRISVSWNLLCGIPGESIDDYTSQMELMNRIPHLTPPGGVSPIRIDRYSPYFTQYQAFGWDRVQSMPEYAALHPHLKPAELEKVAYHFDAVGGNACVSPYIRKLQDAVARWQARNASGAGLYRYGEGLYRIEGKLAEHIRCSRAVIEVLDATDVIAPVDQVLSLPEVDEEMLEGLIMAGVLYRERDGLLNLTVNIPG